MKRFLFCSSVVFLLAACTGGSQGSIILAQFEGETLRPENFGICHGYGCTMRSTVALTDNEWAAVGALFDPPARTATAEQAAIAGAIALLERYSGAQTGTWADEAGAKLIVADNRQQDCVDEAINTTLYLRMMAGEGWLVHHSVGPTRQRGLMIDGMWPHHTATITEMQTGRVLAVDSWFHANGEAPEITAIEIWKKGWSPDQRMDSVSGLQAP